MDVEYADGSYVIGMNILLLVAVLQSLNYFQQSDGYLKTLIGCYALYHLSIVCKTLFFDEFVMPDKKIDISGTLDQFEKEHKILVHLNIIVPRHVIKILTIKFFFLSSCQFPTIVWNSDLIISTSFDPIVDGLISPLCRHRNMSPSFKLYQLIII